METITKWWNTAVKWALSLPSMVVIVLAAVVFLPIGAIYVGFVFDWALMAFFGNGAFLMMLGTYDKVLGVNSDNTREWVKHVRNTEPLAHAVYRGCIVVAIGILNAVIILAASGGG